MEKEYKIIIRDRNADILFGFYDDMHEAFDVVRTSPLKGKLVVRKTDPNKLRFPRNADYNHYVRSLIPDETWRMSDAGTDADHLLGENAEVYYNLARTIPRDKIIICIDCGNNAQSYLFTKHRKYIGVNLEDRPHFVAEGTRYCRSRRYAALATDLTFAISLSEDESVRRKVRETFKNVYVSRGEQPLSLGKLIGKALRLW